MPFCDLILFYNHILADDLYSLLLYSPELSLERVFVGDCLFYITDQTMWRREDGVPGLLTKYIELVTHQEKIVYGIDSLLS